MNPVLAIYGVCIECTGFDEVRSTYGMNSVLTIYGVCHTQQTLHVWLVQNSFHMLIWPQQTFRSPYCIWSWPVLTFDMLIWPHQTLRSPYMELTCSDIPYSMLIWPRQTLYTQDTLHIWPVQNSFYMLIWPHQTPRSPYRMEMACSNITMMTRPAQQKYNIWNIWDVVEQR